ncbi:MAG: hypothetical protein ABIJ05_00700 [Patescibacteria group bacterium]
MKFFTKSELKIVGSILFIIFVISFFNFRISNRRARDNQRKNDLGTLQSALDTYNQSMGTFPLSSSDGKIVACMGSDTYFDKEIQTWINVKVCEWGKDKLQTLSDHDGVVFMDPIPSDPKNLDGISFLYLSNGKRYQLFTYLEGTDEAEFNSIIQARNLSCGNQICNYGRAYSSTPLDKTIEEYENELLKKKEND